ncbi:hypothetical protein GYMLUDRAFT_942266 [Collybiopsis luxurians FD-317 M1]|uniref:Bulb-type lectin domain-containing protein n=1 Tax=Collybiopsis luxurians FD-317 M1 TaxID=944289 RepID=A0A0D0BEV2_9AGAR|nr:hypothetical protein GYMLUDRAFT_942266 [Collybiopsis luxurians FD-317 M1]
MFLKQLLCVTALLASALSQSFVYPYGDELPENGALERGYGLISPSGAVTFGLTESGDLLLSALGKTLWSVTGTDASFVIMQPDGNLVAYTAQFVPVWFTNTVGNDHPYNLLCQDDGNLVLYEGGNIPVWYTNTAGQVP